MISHPTPEGQKDITNFKTKNKIDWEEECVYRTKICVENRETRAENSFVSQ